VPLVISAPGVFDSATSCDDLVSNMDLMPTALDLCGLLESDGGADAGERLDGRSLLPALLGDASRETRARFLLEFHRIRYLYSERAIVTADGWKYVFNPGDTDEVYHLVADPAEMTNLIESAEHAHTVERLQQELMEAVVESGDPIWRAVHKLLGHWEQPSAVP
jgi:arylsulfatase A-like enzyme